MKTIKLVCLLFLSVAFIIRPQKIAKSTCGGWDPSYYDAYSFFEPVSFEEMTDFKWREEASGKDNIEEWKAYFENQPSEEDIREIVYKVSADDMQKIRAYILQSGSGLSTELKNNSLVKYWQGTKNVEAVDYLFYAKICEPEAMFYDEWDDRKRDTEKMKWLVGAGKKYYHEKTTSDFLKLRFAYQSVRMAHYVKDYAQALKLYDELAAPLLDKSESIIKYWVIAHKAGILRSMGKEGEAAYLFSRVFDQCSSKRYTSFLSFEVESDAVWKKTMSLCKNPGEKATLYFMRAVDRNSDVLEEMQQLYAVAPASDYLSLLLVREINVQESSLLDVRLSRNLLFFTSPGKYPGQEEVKHLYTLKSFVEKVIGENKTEEKELWKLASGYLEYMAGNPGKGLEIFAGLKKNTKNKKFKEQIKVFELAIQISGLQAIDDKTEERIYKEVKATGHTKIKDFMLAAFARLYQKQGQIGKAFFCEKGMYDLLVWPDMGVVEDVLKVAAKKKHTTLENDIIFSKTPKEKFLEIKATILFSQDKLQEAARVYNQVPDKFLQKLENDPFQSVIHDYKSSSKGQDAGKYNRKTLLQKIMILKQYAKQNTVEKGTYYFQLGTAYYNISYFGNSWIAIDYYRSHTDLYYDRKNLMSSTSVFVNMAKARYYFEKAMNAADNQGNTELAAKSCFMAAKCEQNQYYTDPATKTDWEGIPVMYAPEWRRNFAILKEEYSNTKYYQKALKECLYFHEFVRR